MEPVPRRVVRTIRRHRACQRARGALPHAVAAIGPHYVNAALAAGFVLHEIGEWPDEGVAEGEPPRLLSVLLAVGQRS